MKEIHLYLVSLPAVRPGCAKCRAPEISHKKGNDGGFTKMLFRRRFTHCAMVIPFILPMHSSWFFRIKPIARLIFKARIFRKPYDFVPIPTIKYYRT